jgi:hypothetical protein
VKAAYFLLAAAAGCDVDLQPGVGDDSIAMHVSESCDDARARAVERLARDDHAYPIRRLFDRCDAFFIVPPQ